MSRMPTHLKDSEREVLTMLKRREPQRLDMPPKLSDIGKLSSKAVTEAICLMAEDKLVQGFGYLHGRDDGRRYMPFVQQVEFAGFYYEIAARLNSIHAALCLVRIASHPILCDFWAKSLLPGPRLGLAKDIIEREVTTNAENCGWAVFSNYMDLYYSAEELKLHSRRADARYFLLGIVNMRYRIKHNLFENPELQPQDPRVQLPHKHLVRIIDHCLRDPNLVLENYPRDRLKEIRQDMLKELADTYNDWEANFTLAIELGDWESEQFKQYLLKSLPQISTGEILFLPEDCEYPFITHAAWLTGLHILEKSGILDTNTATTSPNIGFPTKTIKKYGEGPMESWLHGSQWMKFATIQDASSTEHVKPETWFANRALACAALSTRLDPNGSEQRAAYNVLRAITDEVNETITDQQPYLRDQLKQLEVHLEDLKSEDPKTIRWQQNMFDEVLQKFADPRKLIRQLQKKITVK